MPKRLELQGKKFNSLYVDHFVEFRKGKGYWSCTCDCGNTGVVMIGSQLVSGKLIACQECGKKRQTESKIKHGMAHMPEYDILIAAIARCTQPHHSEWDNYGGRGIRVCQEWIDDPRKFLEHIGPRPSADHSLDRIDVNGNYEPGNVQWATDEEQQNNRRDCRKVTRNGETLTLAQWGRRLGLNPSVIANRIDRGWSEDRWFDPPMTSRECGKASAEARKRAKEIAQKQNESNE